jgi:outer membrane protein TolC
MRIEQTVQLAVRAWVLALAAGLGACAIGTADHAERSLVRTLGARLGPPAAGEPGMRALLEAAAPLRALSVSGTATVLSRGRPLELSAAVEGALRRTRRLRIRGEALVRAQVEEIRSWAGLLPHVALTYTHEEQERGIPALAGGQRTDELRERSDTTALTLSWPLFQGFSWLMDPARAAHAKEAAAHAVRAERLLVTAAAADRFFAVLEAEANRDAARRLHRRLLAWEPEAPSGTAALTLVPAARAEADAEVRRAGAAVADARARLSLLVGAPVAEPISPPRFAETVAGAALSDASLPALVEAALVRRPDVRAARSALATVELEARMTLLETRPAPTSTRTSTSGGRGSGTRQPGTCPSWCATGSSRAGAAARGPSRPSPVSGKPSWRSPSAPAG